jgi:hypothetical protein
MGLCLICQAAVSATLFISEGPQSAVTVAPLATLWPATPRTTVTHQNHRAARFWGKSSWSSVHPKSNDRDAPSNASSAALHGENESRSEPSGECARCQAGYVNDRDHGRRLGLSAPRAFPSSALSGRRSCRWRWGGLEKRSQRRQSQPD